MKPARALARDKADTLLLLAGALLVLAPHAAHLPPWISSVCGATLAWRAAITVRGRRMPPAWLLLPAALAAVSGIFATYGTVLGRDAGVAMLVLLVAFKMLEMRARRDSFVVLFLCFFLALTNFFYSQGIGSALLMALSVVVLLAAQLSFQFTGAVPPLRQRLWMGARIFGLGAPLALLLFVAFPRVEGPLWGMPSDAASARSGLSDSMAPGSLSNLAMSGEPAFRVKFIDPAPPQPALYWRGIVLGAFDGRRWTRVRSQRRAPGGVAAALRGPPLRHQVTLEPGPNRWLFALELPAHLPHLDGNPARMSNELEMSADYPIEQRVRYEVASHVDFSVAAEAPLADSAQWLMLPWGSNRRALQSGAALRAEPEPARRVGMVLERFAREQFVYTLEPPLLGADSVDEFLFATRAGFCEHFAGAFVFLMRAAGVPARVVTGYQGGETNPVDGVLTVRQSDAHAWAEVWLAGRGWTRVDPTAAVAPGRVQRSVAEAAPRGAPFGMAGLGRLIGFEAGADSWIGQLRFTLAAVDNAWRQYVLNYTPQRQRGVLERLAAMLADWRSAAALAALLFLAVLARVIRKRRRVDPVDALYSAMCLQLGRLGLTRAPHEGPSAYASRLATLDLAPEKKAAAARFLRLYSAYKYGAQAPSPDLAATLKSLLTESR